MKPHNHNYVLIMAGGSGSRLYPRSTKELPKQFQKIIGEKTLIEQAYDRARSITDVKNIYISSNHKYVDLIKKHLPEIPRQNYITEPVKKNTGPAIALATALIHKKDKDAVIVATHSDHLVTKLDEYSKGVLMGINVIKDNPEQILCVGISPTSPHTGFGYIERGADFVPEGEYQVYKAKRFVEKPNLEKAKKYLASGKFFWNAGYFIWNTKHFLDELKEFSPDIYKGVSKIAKASTATEARNVIDKEFHKFESIAVDHMIMEKTKNLLVMPLDIGWSDVGSWDVVAKMVDKKKRDERGNYVEGKVIHIDTHNTSVFAHREDKIVATVGLSNLIIVTTEEATIIVPKGRSEEIKKIVEQLEQ